MRLSQPATVAALIKKAEAACGHAPGTAGLELKNGEPVSGRVAGPMTCWARETGSYCPYPAARIF